MELWDDWDYFLKGIAFDHKLTVEQKAVFFVRLSRLSIDEKRTNQEIANEVIGGEPDKAIYAYNKRMKEVFDKLSQSFPEINYDSKRKVERTQACLEKAYLEQQNKKKSEALSSAIAPPDWQKLCREMLETQKQNLRRQVTQMGFELNVYVPLGLVDRKHQSRRSSDFSLAPEQGSGFFQLTEEEIIKTYEHNEFLEQVIKEGQSQKSQGKRIAIIGEPGAGKTTLLEAIAFSPKTPGFPIWISLGSLGEKSLEEYLCQKWLKDALKTSDLTQQQKELEELFKSGQVLLLLDGVDEMPASSPVEALAKIREELTSWVADARVVLTCRINVWDASVNALQGFDTYRTLEFSYGDGNKPDQVKQFICQWFSNTDKPELGEPLREKLDEDRHQRIRDLVKNPMRLSLLCQSWYFRQGDLPETKAALYEQCTEAFYDWKQEAFPTTLTQREELNAALGLLAREAIDKEKSRFGIRENLAIDVMGEDLFNLACKLHWLNFVYQEAATYEKVYVFFHPTFQEYFAACSINDWHFFLNHVLHNPKDTKASYRIFDTQWKELILLWFGRDGDEEFRKQKEAFIKALIEFEDGCNGCYGLHNYMEKEQLISCLMEFEYEYKGFYELRAYFLAAAGIAEFRGCSWGDDIVAQIIEWSLDYFYDNPIAKEAILALEETDHTRADRLLDDLSDRTRVFSRSEDREDTCEYEYRNGIFLAYSILSGLSLEKINAANSNTINHLTDKERTELVRSSIEKLRTNPSQIALLPEIEFLGELGAENQEVIDTLIELLHDTQEQSVNQEVAISLGRIGNGNPDAIKALIELLDSKDEETCINAVSGLGRIGNGNPDAIKALIELLNSSQDQPIRRQIAVSLGRIGNGSPDVIKALIELLNSSKDEWIILNAASSLGQIDPDKLKAIKALINLLHSSWHRGILQRTVHNLVAILQNTQFSEVVTCLKKCLTYQVFETEQVYEDSPQVYENNFYRFKSCYKVILHCTQTMPYPEFYYAWHGQPSTVQPLKNQLIDISSQVQPTDKTYPITLDTQSLKLEINTSAIAQKLCTKIYRKTGYSDIPTVNDAAQLQQYIPRIQEHLQKQNLALILHRCEPNEHLLNFCYSLADEDIGLYIGLITSQPLEQPLKGFLPDQPNLLSAIQSWINEIS